MELVKKTLEIILFDVLNIVKKYIENKEIIGIYVVGSYAREDEDENSDIDIIIITEDVDKEIISEGIYNILIVSIKLLKQKLERDLFPIGQMLKEAKPLLNSNYLNSIKIKITKKNIDWYIKTTEEKLKIVENILKVKNKRLSDRIVYTLVLRIRTFYIIKNIMENKRYIKKDFLKIIKNVSEGENAYLSYIRIKNNEKDKKLASIDEIRRLYLYLKNQLEYVEQKLKDN